MKLFKKVFTSLDVSQMRCVHRLSILISAIFFLSVRAYCSLLTLQVHCRSSVESDFSAIGEANFELDYLAYFPTY